VKRKGNGKICWCQNMAQKQTTLMYMININLGGGGTYQWYVVREEEQVGSRRL